MEASEMAQHTGRLVVQNGFADTITVFQQKVEDVVLLEKVDVLVSEWMGTCLLVRAWGARGVGAKVGGEGLGGRARGGGRSVGGCGGGVRSP